MKKLFILLIMVSIVSMFSPAMARTNRCKTQKRCAVAKTYIRYYPIPKPYMGGNIETKQLPVYYFPENGFRPANQPRPVGQNAVSTN